MTLLKLIAAAPVVLVLTACSNAPSDGDVEKAYRAHVDRVNEQMVQMVGRQAAEGMKVKINSVKNQVCNETGKDVYTCDIQIDIAGPLGRMQQTLPHRLVKGSDGWSLSQMY